MAETLGSEEGTPLRRSAFPRVDCPRRGLPPLRPLDGINTGDVFVADKGGLLKLVFELFLRSINGRDTPLPPPVELGLFLEDRVSKIVLISGGIGTEYMTLTVGQSAAWI
jgi:hypothetical protein